MSLEYEPSSEPSGVRAVLGAALLGPPRRHTAAAPDHGTVARQRDGLHRRPGTLSIYIYVYIYVYICIYTYTHTHFAPDHGAVARQCHGLQRRPGALWSFRSFRFFELPT